jgi:hypothetical protein
VECQATGSPQSQWLYRVAFLGDPNVANPTKLHWFPSRNRSQSLVRAMPAPEIPPALRPVFALCMGCNCDLAPYGLRLLVERHSRPILRDGQEARTAEALSG